MKKVLTTNEQRIMLKLATAINILPEGGKQYLLGYAECAAAMAQAKRQDTGQDKPDAERAN